MFRPGKKDLPAVNLCSFMGTVLWNDFGAMFYACEYNIGFLTYTLDFILAPIALL